MERAQLSVTAFYGSSKPIWSLLHLLSLLLMKSKSPKYISPVPVCSLDTVDHSRPVDTVDRPDEGGRAWG